MEKKQRVWELTAWSPFPDSEGRRRKLITFRSPKLKHLLETAYNGRKKIDMREIKQPYFTLKSRTTNEEVIAEWRIQR